MLSPRKLFVQEIREKIPRISFFLVVDFAFEPRQPQQRSGACDPRAALASCTLLCKRDTMENQPGTDLFFKDVWEFCPRAHHWFGVDIIF